MDQQMYKQIERYIVDIISKNTEASDFKLPSERSLSLKFSSSREPVQRAYDNLIQKGIVTKKHGKGYFINNSSETTSSDAAAPQNPRISLIIPDVTTRFTHNLLTGINTFCCEHHIDLSILISDSNADKENNLVNFAHRSGADGLIVFPVNYDFTSNDALSYLSSKKFPLVLIDRSLPIRASLVTSENHQAMISAVEFLQRKGFQKLVFISSPSSIASTADSRINGFSHGMLRYYKMIEPRNIMITEGTPSEIKNAVIHYLKKNTDTDIIIVSGTMFPAIVMATKELGIEIPRDLKLMIFDDELSHSQKITLKPYIIEQDGYGLGYSAAELLYNQLYGDLLPTTKTLPVAIIDDYADDA